MARGTDGTILHYTAVRLRVNGQGNLRMRLIPMGGVGPVTLPVHAMSSVVPKDPTILTNMRDQHAQLEIKTTAINEVFTINKIMIFVKPSGNGYPQ